jgi:hypothetical protein
MLVIFNVRDFPPAKFAAAGMRVLTPAQSRQHYLSFMKRKMLRLKRRSR